jgi:hypothetical protein
VCACTHGFRWFDSPGSPAHFCGQAGLLVTRRVLVADATFKRPIDFWGVLDGHKLPTPEGSTYAGVVSRESVRIALTYAALNGLELCAADIKNAHLQAPPFCKD